jgi:hypothetical protein
MYPSGYKEDKIYSLKPTDGSGDLTFTRASTATRVNSAGLVEVVPLNLVQNSETFSGGWTTANLSISANTTTAPNGTTTADTITEDTSTTRKILYTDPTIVANQEITLTIYVKKNTLQYVRLIANDLAENFRWFGAQFDLTALTYTSATGSNGNATFTSASITDAGNGWYRIAVSGTINTTSLLFGIFPSNGATLSSSDDRGGNTYLGTGKTAYIWGAQLNIGSTAKTYFPTTDRLNVPRIDYTGGGCGSLLLEKQSTNLVNYSEDFTNGYWISSASITANTVNSPDGTQNADTVVFASNNQLYNGTVRTSGNYSLSVFVKKGNNRYFSIQLETAVFAYQAIYDLDTTTVTNTTANTTASITDFGGGWFRVTVMNTTAAIITFTTFQAALSGTIITNGAGTYYLWGAQLEASSYPTSYIPTVASSVTRLADVASKTGISSLIGQTEGVLFADFNFEQKGDTSGNVVILLRGSSSEAYIYLTSSNVQADFISGGIQCSILGSIGAVGRKKIAFAYKQNDFALYMNGVQIGTDSSGTVGSLTALTIGSYDSPGYVLNSGINQAALFKTRLTNAELASLTTI